MIKVSNPHACQRCSETQYGLMRRQTAWRSMLFFLLAVMNFPEGFCAQSSMMISNPHHFGCNINATKCNRLQPCVSKVLAPACMDRPPCFGERGKIAVLRHETDVSSLPCLPPH